MKIIISFIFSILFYSSLIAQAPPEAFNYTGAVRDASGNPISNKTISTELSILQNSENGTLVYRERHTVTTDKFGVFNCSVGQGSIQEGSFTSINWGAGSYFLKVALDIEGGNNYNVLGSTQLLSVPYALYAKKSSDNVIPVITAQGNVSISGQGTESNPYVISSNAGFKRYIGEQFGGGVIFHLWKDSLGIEHGLIVDIEDLSTSQVWSNIKNISIGASAQSEWNGINNSNAIINQAGHTSSAAKLCLDLVRGGQNDWYLPSIVELSMLSNNYYEVVRALSQIPGATILKRANYWSSTENDNDTGVASVFNFFNGSVFNGDKDELNFVRAIRAF